MHHFHHTVRWFLSALLLLALPGCSLFRQDLVAPEIQVVALQRLPGSNLLDQRFALGLQVSNPNDMTFHVRGIQIRFAIAGVELMQGVSNEVPVIEPYGTARFTLQGSANVVQLAKLLRKMQRKPDKRHGYTITAHIEMERGWPASFNITRDGDFAFRDWLQEVSLPQASPMSASTVAASTANPT